MVLSSQIVIFTKICIRKCCCKSRTTFGYMLKFMVSLAAIVLLVMSVLPKTALLG